MEFVLLVAAPFVVAPLVAAPLLYFYLRENCPGPYTFDAKREVKRVLSSALAPDGALLGRAAAWVALELTALQCAVSITDVMGAMRTACVELPTMNCKTFWIGALNNWHYLFGMELSGASKYSKPKMQRGRTGRQNGP
jgi:hypothetical protein